LTSNIRRVLNVVLFPLGNSAASEFYASTFRNTLSVPSSQAVLTTFMKMEETECSETSTQNSDAAELPKRKNTKYIVFRETVKLLLSVIYILYFSA